MPSTALACPSHQNTVHTSTSAVTLMTAAVICSLDQWLTDTPVSHAMRRAPTWNSHSSLCRTTAGACADMLMELNPSTDKSTMANVEAFALVMISFVELVGATPSTALACLSQ